MSLNAHLVATLACGKAIEVPVRQTPTWLSEAMLQVDTTEATELYLAWLKKTWPRDRCTINHKKHLLEIINDKTVTLRWEIR